MTSPESSPALVRPFVTVSPNRARGYDATAHTSGPKWLIEEIGSAVHTVNAPSETAARALALAWIDAQPKAKRAPRAPREISEGEAETREAARKEREHV